MCVAALCHSNAATRTFDRKFGDWRKVKISSSCTCNRSVSVDSPNRLSTIFFMVNSLNWIELLVSRSAAFVNNPYAISSLVFNGIKCVDDNTVEAAWLTSFIAGSSFCDCWKKKQTTQNKFCFCMQLICDHFFYVYTTSVSILLLQHI